MHAMATTIRFAAGPAGRLSRSWPALVVAVTALSAPPVHSQSQSPVRAALVRLEIAVEQGVSFDKFSDLLLDAKAQLALVGPPPQKDAADALAAALNDADNLRTLWAASLLPDCGYECEARVRSALQALRLVRNDDEMTLAIGLIAADSINHTGKEWNRLLHEASVATLLAMTSADKALQQYR
jgi:hypothetical protein